MSSSLGETILRNLAEPEPEDISLSLEAGSEFAKCISWSKNGFIAYAVPGSIDKHNLLLTYLERVDEGSWQLAPSQRISVKPATESSQCYPLSLVSWSNLNTDLAVSDLVGNFYIYLAGVGVLDKPESSSAEKVTKNGNGSSTNGSDGVSSSNIAPSTSTDMKSSLSYELTSYNHLEMIYRDTVDKPKHPPILKSNNSIVAFKWLNIEKPQILNKPATHSAPNQAPNSPFTYNYGVSQSPPQGVTHPIPTKQACVALRRNGEMDFYYQGEHKVEYHKLACKLEGDATALHFATASIGFNKGKEIYITGYDTYSNMIKSYSAAIDWGYLVEAAQKQKLDPHYQTPVAAQTLPTLTVRNLNAMSPMTSEVNELDEENQEDGNYNKPVKSNVDDMEVDETSEKISPTTAARIGKLQSIDIISASQNADSDLEILISYETFPSNNLLWVHSTTIFRYRIAISLDGISEAFADLGARKNIQQPQVATNKFVLALQDKIVREGTLQSIDTSISDSFILITYENGKIDVIDREAQTIVNDPNAHIEVPPLKITSLFDIGFQFPEINSDQGPNMIAISPNLTSLVYTNVRNPHQQLTFSVVVSKREVSITPKELFITSVGFAFRHAYACYTNVCSDDLLALIQIEVIRIRKILHETLPDKQSSIDTVLSKFIESIICESHKAISFQLDVFGRESVDKLLSNPPLQKLLSLQLILGEFQGQGKVIRDIAWIVLNLRSTSFGIMFLLSSIYRKISKKKPAEDTLQDSITRAECITSLIGSVKWLIDLMIYLNQELIQLSNKVNEHESENVLSFNNSVVLPVILSKIPRLFLMYALSSIGKTNEILKKLHKDLSDCNKVYTPMKDALNRYFTIYNNSPLNVPWFENFLRECDAFITAEVTKESNLRGKNFPVKLEQKLVCQGEISGEMQKVARTVVAKYSTSIRRELKISELFFYDVDWLSIGTTNEVCKHKQNSDCTEENVIRQYPNLSANIKPRLHFANSYYIDGLRKVVLEGGPNFDSNVLPDSKQQIVQTKIRKCTRCRSVSYVNDPLAFASPTTIGLWTMVFQRTCICGSAWINCN